MNLHVLRTALLAILATASLHSYAQNPFTVNGQLDKNIQGQIDLYYNNTSGKIIKDSANVVNGTFTIKSKSPAYTGLAYMELNRHKTVQEGKYYDWQELFIEDGATITIRGAAVFSDAKITGGKAQADFNTLNTSKKPTTTKIGTINNEIRKLKQEGNDTEILRLVNEAQVLDRESKKLDSLFIAGHPNSDVALDLWNKAHQGLLDPELEVGFSRFSTRIQNTQTGKKIAERFAISKTLSPGKPAPDFTLNDTDGKPVSLSSLKGKNVLLFFWYPNVMGWDGFVALMRRVNIRLKDKNFVILSVYYNHPALAGSEDPERWKAMVNEYSMNWINVSDIDGISEQGPESPLAKAYGLDLKSVYQAHLIGPDGKIVAWNLPLMDDTLPSKIEKLIMKP